MNEPASRAQHNGPVPSQWDELISLTETAQLAVVHEKLGAMDGDTFDEHRYYAYGEIMCGLAKTLEDPATQQDVVEAAGKNLFGAWCTNGSVERDSLLPVGRDFRSSSVNCIFGQPTEQAAASLSPAARTLGDVFHRTGRIRAASSEHFVLRNERAAKFVGEVAGSATINVFLTVLNARAAYLAAQDPERNARIYPMTAAEVMQETEITNDEMLAIGARCAALRLDELRQIREYVTTDKNGLLVFHRELMTPKKDLQPPTHEPGFADVLHTGRLRCPALFVEGFIGTMLNLVPRITLEADRLARARHASMQGLHSTYMPAPWPKQAADHM